MALKKGLTDPLNWLLLLLAGAFIYYIFAVPYFFEYYMKTPQQMTFSEYLANPAHPRPFMLHALSNPPASTEIVLHGLTVKHVDQDSILLEDASVPSGTTAAATPMPAPAPAEGESDGSAAAPAFLEFAAEAAAPNNQILIPGDNLDLLPVQVGMQISLQLHDLHQSPLGWIPRELTVGQTEEQYYNKQDLDELALLKVIVGGNAIPVPYIEVDEMRFAPEVHPAGEPFTLEQLSNDTSYIQTANRLAGSSVDVYDVRIVERLMLERAPYFVFEDAQGRRGHVFYNQRLLSEWYWVQDRLGDGNIVVRGTLRPFAPNQLRDMEAEGNVQVVIDGYALLSRDGSTVISLENPLGSVVPTPQ